MSKTPEDVCLDNPVWKDSETMPIHDAPLPEPLERRPEARSIRVEDLLAEVRRGRVRIPAFQRDLKWTRDDALQLLDSIYRGYPIGTLLLWETRAAAEVLGFGPMTIAATARPDAWWVVDGQQRVVSLARVLLASHPSSDEFALYFDLDLSKFVSMSSVKNLAEDAARWLPLAVVLDSEQLFRWMLEHQPVVARRERAVRVGKRIREYDVPVYVVHTDSESTLREIFGRVNNTGRRLEQAEVFDALHGARSPHRPATIADIAAELEELRFGRVEQKILYRLLRVLIGADVTDSVGKGSLRLDEGEAQRAYADTATAAREAVQFLKVDAGIATYDLLPYKQSLVTLGKFFHHYPTPKQRSRELLVRWLWRGALNGAHRGDTVSTRRALDQIDGSDEERSVQRMLSQVGTRLAPLPEISEPFNFRFAYSKLQTLALLDLQPRDLESGDVFAAVDIFDRLQLDEETPLPDIVTSGYAFGLDRSVANRLVHPRRPGLKRLLLTNANEKALVSHAIGREAIVALKAGNTADFLRIRGAALERHFVAFFDQRARWDDPDRPSLQSLAVAEED